MWRLHLNKLLNFDVCVVWWCSDGPINSQEYKRFEMYAVTIKISMTEYHHWINRHTIYSNTAVYGEKLVRWIWSLVYFHFFEALNGAFEVQFSGLHLYKLSKTLIACRDMQLRIFKVKTLLNNVQWRGMNF